MKLLTVKQFDTDFQAQLFRSKLEAEGIECFVFGENMASLAPSGYTNFNRIIIKIKEEDSEKVKDLFLLSREDGKLTDLGYSPQKIPAFEGKIQCPKCNSKNVTKRFLATVGFLGVILSIIALFAVRTPVYNATLFQCENCKIKFKKAN